MPARRRLAAWRGLFSARLGLALALVLAGLADSQAAETPVVQSVCGVASPECPPPVAQVHKNLLVVGSEQNYPPLATGMTDATAGGFTVDLWKAVAAEMGLHYTVRVRPFHQLLQEFKDGQIDVLINLANSEARHRFADFTVPHVITHGAIFVRKGETGIYNETDLRGKSVIVLNGDLAHDYALSNQLGKQLVLVDTSADGFRLLASGKYDAMLLSKLSGMQTLQTLGLHNIEALPVRAGFSQKFSFAVHEGQSELLGQLNEGLALTKSNGTYGALYEKWLGVYEDRQFGWRDALKYLSPVVLIFLLIAAYFFWQRKIERQEAEAKLRVLHTALEQSPISVVITDVDAHIEYVNPRFSEITGFSAAEVIGQNPRILQSGVTPAATYQTLWDALTQGRAWHGELVNRRKNRELYWEEAHIAPIKNAAGVTTQYVAAKVDITERKAAENALRQSEKRFRLMLENSPIAVRITQLDTGRVVFANPSYAQLIATEPARVIGVNPVQYYADQDDYKTILEQLSQGQRVTNRLIKLVIPSAPGQTKWALASYMSLVFQNEPAVLGWFYDISDRKAMEEQVQHLAHYDPLTDLPNRTLFSDRLQRALVSAKRDQVSLALMFIDLDKFKPINDTLGHHVGDLLLKETAQRIQSCLRESDTVARIGGDEFVVLLPVIESEQDAIAVAEKIRFALNQPFTLGGQQLSISSSTGIALYPEHGHDEKQLIKNADAAMYDAKASGRNTVRTYTPPN